MTTWEAVQNAIDSGKPFVVSMRDMSAEELDELEQISDERDGLRYSGVTPDGDAWTVEVTP